MALSIRRNQVHQFKETARADPYRSTRKIAGVARCPKCKAMNIRGRWLSANQAASVGRVPSASRLAPQSKCPACRQQEDRFAQGVVELHGENFKEKRELVENTIRRSEEIARVRNDQERVLWTQDRRGVTKVYVTLPELARRIGRELERSFKGAVEYHRSTEEPYLRVQWWSDAPHFKHRGGAPLKLKRQSKAQVKEEAHRSRSFRGRGRV